MPTRFGILHFDTDDDSVVFRSSMTSLSSITAIGGLDRSTGNNVFDAVKGMSPRINGSSVSGINFHLSTMTLESGSHDNLPQGQFSFEVERKFLAVPASVIDSECDGYDNATDECMVAWSPNNGASGTLGYMYKCSAANNYIVKVKSGQSGEMGSAYYSSSAVLSQWAKVTVSWTANHVTTYIDGRQMQTPRYRSALLTLTQFGEIYLGNYGNTSSVPNWNNQYFMRNFIMASRPVSLASHPSLAYIVSMGDSFAGGQYQQTTTTIGDINENNVVAGRLISAGFSFGTYDVYSNGGGQVLNSGTDDIKTDVNGVNSKTRADVAGDKPTFIVFQGGVNDKGIYTSPAFLNDLKEHVMELMADGVTYTANVAAKRMILVAQVTGVNGVGTLVDANMRLIRDDILSIPAWWDATYPARAGHVGTVSQWDLLSDGTNTYAEYFNADFVHPNSLGDAITGNLVADKMLKMIGGS